MRERSERVGEPRCICRGSSFTWPFLLGLVFFRTTIQLSGGLSPAEGWDAVGLKCEKAQY